jgi:hypothetical protein
MIFLVRMEGFLKQQDESVSNVDGAQCDRGFVCSRVVESDDNSGAERIAKAQVAGEIGVAFGGGVKVSEIKVYEIGCIQRPTN